MKQIDKISLDELLEMTQEMYSDDNLEDYFMHFDLAARSKR